MKLPAKRTQLRVRPDEHDAVKCTLIQTARSSRGTAGLVYWYAVLPLHGLVFKGMLDGIRRRRNRPHVCVPGDRKTAHIHAGLMPGTPDYRVGAAVQLPGSTSSVDPRRLSTAKSSRLNRSPAGSTCPTFGFW